MASKPMHWGTLELTPCMLDRVTPTSTYTWANKVGGGGWGVVGGRGAGEGDLCQHNNDAVRMQCKCILIGSLKRY